MKISPLPIQQLPASCSGPIHMPVHIKFRRGKFRGDERKSIESATSNLKAIAKLTKRPDWSSLNILDYGCGVKFTQALVQYNIKVKNYVGMDVYEEMINYLDQNTSHSNFHYHHVPFKNEMYNPNGIELSAQAKLPGQIEHFDLITLQSVFTHFNPEDFLNLLKVLKNHSSNGARMLFTCFIDNDMKYDFFDSVPEKPLLKAYYKESFIRAMLAKAGWKPLLLNPPGSHMQHHFVCEPC